MKPTNKTRRRKLRREPDKVHIAKGWWQGHSIFLSPALLIRKGRSEIRGIKSRVDFPGNYGRKFKRGEKVLQLYLNSTNPRETIELMKKFEESREELRKAGYAGFFADTPNQVVANALERRGMEKVRTHWGIRAVNKYLYANDIVLSGFPARHILGRMRRLVSKL